MTLHRPHLRLITCPDDQFRAAVQDAVAQHLASRMTERKADRLPKLAEPEPHYPPPDIPRGLNKLTPVEMVWLSLLALASLGLSVTLVLMLVAVAQWAGRAM